MGRKLGKVRYGMHPGVCGSTERLLPPLYQIGLVLPASELFTIQDIRIGLWRWHKDRRVWVSSWISSVQVAEPTHVSTGVEEHIYRNT
jgi:hypothetical protein